MPTDEILEALITFTVTLTFADYLRLNFWASFVRTPSGYLVIDGTRPSRTSGLHCKSVAAPRRQV